MTLFSKLRELEKKATPGPWFDDRTIKCIRVDGQSPAFSRGDFHIFRYPTRTNKSLVSHEEWESNANLIVEVRARLPKIFEVLDLYEEVLREADEIILGEWGNSTLLKNTLKRAKEIAGE